MPHKRLRELVINPFWFLPYSSGPRRSPADNITIHDVFPAQNWNSTSHQFYPSKSAIPDEIELISKQDCLAVLGIANIRVSFSKEACLKWNYPTHLLFGVRIRCYCAPLAMLEGLTNSALPVQTMSNAQESPTSHDQHNYALEPWCTWRTSKDTLDEIYQAAKGSENIPIYSSVTVRKVGIVLHAKIQEKRVLNNTYFTVKIWAEEYKSPPRGAQRTQSLQTKRKHRLNTLDWAEVERILDSRSVSGAFQVLREGGIWDWRR